MHSTTRSIAFASALLVACAQGACGGDVVVTTEGQSEAAAGPGGGATGAGASSVGSTGQGAASTSSAVQSSSSGGPPNPCLGAPCGAECTVCNDVECFMGACGDSGTCEMPSLECKTIDPAQPCPPPDQAPALLCSDCGGGKGCSFFGCVIGGPEGGDGTCCYDIVGGCVPNP